MFYLCVCHFDDENIFLRRKLIEQVVSYNFEEQKNTSAHLAQRFLRLLDFLDKLPHHLRLNFLAASINILMIKDCIPLPPIFNFIFFI